MDAVRYYVALLALMFTPPAFLYWFSIHPLIRFWRSLRPSFTLTIHYVGMCGLAALIYLVHRPLLSVEFGANPILMGLAVPLLALSFVLRRKLSKHLRFRVLTGLPELSPDRHRTPLLTEGIYGMIRHPRYVQFLLAVAGYALFCNYLATYIMFLALLILVNLLVRIEERELRDRYGAEYDAYCIRVPRFVPKRRT